MAYNQTNAATDIVKPKCPFEDGVAALESGSLVRAEHLLMGVSQDSSNYTESRLALSTVAYTSGRYEAAIELLKEASELSDKPEIMFGMATAYKAMGEDAKALSVFKHLSEVGGVQEEYAYAQALIIAEDFETAQEVLTALNNTIPDDVNILFSLATVERELGLIDEPVQTLKRVLEIDAGYVNAYISILGLTKYTPDLFDIDALMLLTKSIAISEHTEALLLNTLGRAYEARGEYKLAFGSYDSANKIIRKTLPDDTTSLHRTKMEEVKAVYTKEILAPFQSDKESPLVFIFGMPRSGSTLVEQILVNHPDVSTQGETDNVATEIASFIERIGKDSTGSDFPINQDDLGNEYMSIRVGDVDTKFVIDKMPANYNYIGLMYMLFPNAKFIHTARNKADTCLSGWSVMYTSGHHYSYTLEEIKEEHAIHDTIVNHWKEVLPEGAIHTVQYEDMVANFEEEAKALCDYVGIELTQDMKEFHKLKRKVNTASIGQVNTPLYQTSSGRTAKFGDLLEVLK